MKKVYFSGDSFTYGEGLELFTPSEKWLGELEKQNTWDILSKKNDTESNEFRKNNNFVGIFRNHFKNTLEVYQHDGNGGSLSFDMNKRIPDDFSIIGDVDYLVIQFTSFSRNSLHLNYSCECDFCKKTDYNTFNEIFDEFINYKYKKTHNKFLIEEVCNIIKFHDLNDISIIDRIDKFYRDSIKEQIDIFKQTHLQDFKKKGIEVFFIDSWSSEASDILQLDSDIRERTIPLIGLDGNLYKKWNEWEATLVHPYIYQKYPKTANHHPTLETHKLISRSLIDYFNKIL